MSPCLLLPISSCFYSQVKCSIFVLPLQLLSSCGLLHYVFEWFFQYSLLCRTTVLSSFKFTGNNADILHARLEKMIIITVPKILKYLLLFRCHAKCSSVAYFFCVSSLSSMFLILQKCFCNWPKKSQK